MNKFRKILVLILALAMVLSSTILVNADEFFPDIPVSIANPYVKVGLYYGSTYKNSCTLKCNDGFIIYDENMNELSRVADTTLEIADPSYSGKVVMSANPDIDSRIVSITTTDGTKQYRDGFYFLYNNGFRIINYVTLEHYVWGVLNCEMSSRNPVEALKAQAIAVRSFALTETKHKAQYGFDVCAATDCQVYRGFASESDVTTQAAKDTEGLVMCYDGKIVRGYFSASSGGGYTMSSKEAWGTEKGYLQSVKDDFTPEHTWRTMYTFDELKTRLFNAGFGDVGQILSVGVSERNSFGAVTKLTIITTNNGAIDLNANKIMSYLKLRSVTFSVGATDYKEIEKTEKTPDNYYVLSADGLNVIPATEVYVYDGNTVDKLNTSSVDSYSYPSDICTTGTVYLNGIGNGHGVGLSQNGAFAMANAGYSYDQILKYYYTNITIENCLYR